MKISLKWINELVDVSDYFARPQELGDLLTSAGLEVEDLQDGSTQFEHVVVGHILEKGQHPDADKLSLCRVSTGDQEHQIICGAKNHQSGDKVVVALPGAVLPGDFKIKLSKIRGVESAGMLCSEKELGLSGEAEGIIILPEEAPIGQSFAEYQGLDDVVFELKVTPNRADCLSHVGLARELGSLLGREVKMPQVTLTENGQSTKNTIQLDVKDAERCPRFTGRYMTGVKVGPSPGWLSRRLEALGINAINNVVDITNYVMLEYGQPMHAYDSRELNGGRIVVDTAVAQEPFVTFDGTELKLSGEELTIRDGERCVGLAGIIGGKNSGIQDDTQDVFLECAYFVPASIRRTSRKFGLETDACYRFSRGVDPSMVMQASERACQLLQEHCGAELYSDVWDFYPQQIQRESIDLNCSWVSRRLGYEISQDRIEEILQTLGCELESSGEDLKVLPPLYRWDLEQDMDLIEEVARINGYDKIPERLPAFDMEPTRHDKSYLNEKEVTSILSGMGFLQAVNYSFIGGDIQAQWLGSESDWQGVSAPGESISLKNPLNEELNTMRRSLMPGLLKNLIHNVHHKNEIGQTFEIGRVFGRESEKYVEQSRLALVSWGEAPEQLWKTTAAPQVFQMKSAVETLLRQLGVSSWQWRDLKSVPSLFHPGQAAVLVVEGRDLGVLGRLHPAWCDEQKVRMDVAAAELNFDQLMARHPRAVKFQSISKFPAVTRDLAFVLPKNMPVTQIIQGIKKSAGKDLTDVTVTDQFEGESVGADKRSVTFRMTFQNLDRTLDDKNVNEAQQKVIGAIESQFSVSVR